MLETAIDSHEEAAAVVLCTGTIVRSGLVSPGGHLPRAEHYRRATWAALTQGRGHQTPWGGDGIEGVLCRVSTAPTIRDGCRGEVQGETDQCVVYSKGLR